MKNHCLIFKLGSPKSRGEKRPFQEIENLKDGEKSPNDISETELIISKKKFTKMAKRMKFLETNWMRKLSLV